MTIVFLRPICRSTQQDSIRWQATCILQGTASFGQDRHIWFCIHCLLLFHTYNLITERKIWPQITWRWRLTKTSTGPDRPTDLHSIETIWWFHEPERKKNWRKHSLGPGIVGTPKVSLRSAARCSSFAWKPQCFQAHGPSKILETFRRLPHIAMEIYGIWPISGWFTYQGHEIGTLAPHVAPALGVVFHAKLRTNQTAP